MEEQRQRAAVVAEARSWIGTPFHHQARVKGAGVDCAQLLIGVFANLGLIEPPALAHYPPDWHLHQSGERYMAAILDLTREIEGPPLPGDIVIYRFGRCFSHGAIVIGWPMIIHAYVGRPCTMEDAEAAQWLQFVGEIDGRPRPRRYVSYWGRS